MRARFYRLLLGCAVGDALGLPAEGLSPGRLQRLWAGDWRMRLVCGRGMFSDDTEHTLLVAQSLLEAPREVDVFARQLAARLRWWLLGIPAGTGKATAKACIRLWLGVSPQRSGVSSAGNGPAMRSAIIGAFFADDEDRRRSYVRASSRMTHSDPRAEVAALAVAEAAAWEFADRQPSLLMDRLASLDAGEEWQGCCRRMVEGLQGGLSVPDFAKSLGQSRGVSGYSFHSLPVALYGWMRHPGDFRRALTAVLDCGGDADSTGAVVASLAGLSSSASIPEEWSSQLMEWPRNAALMERLADRLTVAAIEGTPGPAVKYFWPGILPRNLFFFAVVMVHGFRRLLPPY